MGRKKKDGGSGPKKDKAEVLVPEVVEPVEGGDPAEEDSEQELLNEEALAGGLPLDELEVLPAEDTELEDRESRRARREKNKSTPSKSAEVVRYDPLEAYLREIRAYPPLSKEEETEIAIRYYTQKDLQAAYRLVTSNLWLVVKIARDYEKAARGLLDLVQEGNIGLMEAVKNFDPYRGVRFPSYAVWWIKAYMVRYLIANWRLVKIGTTQAQRKLFFNLKKEKEKLEREGFYPAPKLLAEKLNVKESEVVEMEQRLGSADMSVDAPIQGPESDATLLSLLPAPQASAEELVDQKQAKAIISQGFEEFASTLNPKEALIFKERMLGEDKATLQDVAEKLSLSRERVRQIENRIREKLKVFLEDKFGSEIENLEF